MTKRVLTTDVIEQIAALRRDGLTHAAIAEKLQIAKGNISRALTMHREAEEKARIIERRPPAQFKDWNDALCNRPRPTVAFNPAAVRTAIAHGPEAVADKSQIERPRPIRREDGKLDMGNGIRTLSPKAWLEISEDERRARAKARRQAEEKRIRDEAKAVALAAISKAIDVAKEARSAALAELEAEACRGRREFRKLAGPNVRVSEPHIFARLDEEAKALIAHVESVEEAAFRLRKGNFISAIAALSDNRA